MLFVLVCDLTCTCSEPMWPIEARNAAIANSYFVGAINRVGTVSSYLVFDNLPPTMHVVNEL